MNLIFAPKKITRFAKSGNPREIYFSPRFLDFRRRRGDNCPKKLISHVTKESLFLKKEGVSDTFLRKKFVMSLFRIIFAF